jgi:MYXO-CTERM domain-containing protein
MSTKFLLSSSLALVTMAMSSAAFAQHDVQSYLSQKGLDFIAEEAPLYIPKVLQPPTFGKSVACVDFEQRNTVINLSIENLKISMPEDGRVRIEFDFSGDATGELYADDIYACFGEVTCQDSLDLRKATAVLDYELRVVDGQTRAIARNTELNVVPSDIQFQLSDCGFTGDALTSAVDFTEEWLLTYVEGMVEDVAEEKLGPFLESILDGFTFEGSLSLASYKAKVKDLTLSNGGLALGIDADIVDKFAPAPCVEKFDTGGPQDFAGEVPDLTGPNAYHANLAVNLGLLNKGFYTFWRRGLLCLTDQHVQALGVELDLNTIGALLPGFPPGTDFSFEFGMEDYPRMRPHDSDNSQVSFHFGGVTIDLHGDRPDGTRNTLHVEIDMGALATVGINPTTNAIYAQLDGAVIERMVMEDERKVVGDGFDVARIKQMVHDHILPKLLAEMGPVPLSGPTFALGEYAVLLRQMTTNDAYMSAGIDLFKIPSDDTGAPETTIDSFPTGIVNPHDAVIFVNGTDAEIPSELLQYVVAIDGEAEEANFVHAYRVGEAGKTASYLFQVSAVDLSGNIDPTPQEVEVTVDGIAPQLNISGRRIREASEGPAQINWTMGDDLTAATALPVRVEIYEVEDPQDALSTRLLRTQELPPGTMTAVVELDEPGGLYRVEVHVSDEAGNDSESSILLTVASSGGCSVGGAGAGGNAGLLLLALGLLIARRRRAS